MLLTGELWYDCITHKSTVNVIYSGVATGGGQGGHSATPDSKKFAKNQEKEGKSEKMGKKEEKSGRKGKIGQVLSLCPSWQTGLATLLVIKQWLSNLSLIYELNIITNVIFNMFICCTVELIKAVV